MGVGVGVGGEREGCAGGRALSPRGLRPAGSGAGGGWGVGGRRAAGGAARIYAPGPTPRIRIGDLPFAGLLWGGGAEGSGGRTERGESVTVWSLDMPLDRKPIEGHPDRMNATGCSSCFDSIHILTTNEAVSLQTLLLKYSRTSGLS